MSTFIVHYKHEALELCFSNRCGYEELLAYIQSMFPNIQPLLYFVDKYGLRIKIDSTVNLNDASSRANDSDAVHLLVVDAYSKSFERDLRIQLQEMGRDLGYVWDDTREELKQTYKDLKEKALNEAKNVMESVHDGWREWMKPKGKELIYCDCCGDEAENSFYGCLECRNYHLCSDCFGNRLADHGRHEFSYSMESSVASGTTIEEVEKRMNGDRYVFEPVTAQENNEGVEEEQPIVQQEEVKVETSTENEKQFDLLSFAVMERQDSDYPLTAGESFTKVWTLMNNGNVTWHQGSFLKQTKAFENGMDIDSITLPQLLPLEKVNVEASLTAPSIPDQYSAEWEAIDVHGNVFGKLECQIDVIPEDAGRRLSSSSVLKFPLLETENDMVWVEADNFVEDYVIVGDDTEGYALEGKVSAGFAVKEAKIIPGGYCLQMPFLQQVQRLDLSVMTLNVYSPTVYTSEGVPLTVSSVAQVKILQMPTALKLAAGHFLGMSRKEIMQCATQSLEGHQRAIMSTMTVESIYQDREKFADEVTQVAAPDVAKMGLEIISFTIKDLEDSEGYLESLGKKTTAQAKRDAKIGEAEAERDAGIAVAESTRLAEEKKYEAQIQIAAAEKEYQVLKAKFDKEVNSKEAEADLAGPLQDATTRKELKAAEMDISITEKQGQIKIDEQEVKRKEWELTAIVELPAAAEKTRLELIAEANKKVGQADSDVIRAKGIAEAEAMKAKAEAWKSYSDAAYMEMIIEQLPKIAAELAKPLNKTDKIVLVNGDGGATVLGKDVAKFAANVPPLVDSLTGIDINKAISSYIKGK